MARAAETFDLAGPQMRLGPGLLRLGAPGEDSSRRSADAFTGYGGSAALGWMLGITPRLGLALFSEVGRFGGSTIEGNRGTSDDLGLRPVTSDAPRNATLFLVRLGGIFGGSRQALEAGSAMGVGAAHGVSTRGDQPAPVSGNMRLGGFYLAPSVLLARWGQHGLVARIDGTVLFDGERSYGMLGLGVGWRLGAK